MLKNTRQIVIKGFLLLMLCFAFLGCKKYFDPPDVFEEQTIVNVKRKKVLLIGIDGITGADLKIIAPPKIQEILNKSKYSYSGWTDVPVSDAGSWKNIMTGVSVGTHGVADSSFDASSTVIGSEHDARAVYPTFIERLQGSGKIRYSSAITTWKKLSDKLFIYADFPVVVANDALVKDSTLKKIAEPNMDLVIANFNGANKAGLTSGFDANVTEYKNAVLQLDSYIGELLAGVKARPTYAKEDWLVVITSTHGGDGKSFTNGSKRTRNIFTIYHHPDFIGKELPAQPVVDAVTTSSKNVLASLSAASSAAYGLGTTGDFTIQFKVNLKAVPSGTSHATILSKISAAYGSAAGWEFMYEASTKYFRVVLGNGTSALKYLVGTQVTDLNKWYSLALRVYTEGGKRYAQLYQDGKAVKDPTDITGFAMGTASDFVVGTISSSLGTCTQTVSQLSIYNTAISPQAIQDFVCQEQIPTTDPFFNNLVGYWPANDAQGNILKNQAPNVSGKDLTITTANGANFAWAPLAAWTCTNGKLYLTQNSDISQQIYYWFGANIEAKWVTNGKVWLSDFESEFIK
jgi:hypothetical protein